jgi:hypothetical protein
MPKGPQGQKRPADAIGLAVMIGKIATGEIEDNSSQAAKRNAGKLGGTIRAEKMQAGQRSAIAKMAADKRWGK